MSSPVHLRELLGQLWAHVPARHKRWFLAVFALSAVAAFAEVLTLGALYPFIVVLVAPDQVASIGVFKRFIDWIPTSSRTELLLTLTAGFITAVMVATMLRAALLLLQTTFVNRLGSALSIEIYRRTLHQPYRVHMARNSSEVISVIAGKVNGVVSSVLMPIIVICSSIIMLVAVMLSLLAVHPQVAVGMLGGFGCIYAAVALSVRARLARESQIAAEHGTITVKALQEGLGGIRDILIDGTQELFCRVFRDADFKARKAASTISFIANLPRSVIEGAGMALIAGMACALALASDNPGGAVPVLGVVALGAQRMMPLAQGLYNAWGTMLGHTHALREVLALLDQPMVTDDRRDIQPLPFNTSLELVSVGFRYGEGQQPVLKNINLLLPKGTRLGVIGPTGSGKSTLIDLLLGLLEPTAGEIRVDGVALDEAKRRRWQQRVAHVPQSIFLADASIAENIAFGQPKRLIDMDRVAHAARRAQIADTIEGLPEGYHTRIGERGVRLSGGQRQRIGIARALYKQADVLVLDEATSALDNQTETAVMSAVEQLDGDLTIIMIAHRLSTLRSCDLVVKLSEGTIAATGSYETVTGLTLGEGATAKAAA